MNSNHTDHKYRDLINSVLSRGVDIPARNGACKRVFAEKVVFHRTPLVAARRTAWKLALREWEWFMSGSSNINDLHESVRHWWQPWTDVDTNLVLFNYSYQFRHFNGSDPVPVDQIEYMLNTLREHPNSRRNCAATWNTADMMDPACSITNCHGSFIQWFVDPNNEAHLVMYQRSCDVICGVPHNWIQYWAFLLWMCHRSGRAPGTFTWIGGDVHVYEKHRELAEKIMVASYAESPELVYIPTSEEFRADDFSLDGEYHPVLEDKAEMIV